MDIQSRQSLQLGDAPLPPKIEYFTHHFERNYTMENRTRKHSIILRLNDNEYAILIAKYKVSNLSNRNAFLRQLIVEGFVYDVDYSQLREYNYNLSKIGTNINQIAKRLNQTNSIHKHEIELLQQEMKKIWQLQKSMVSNQPYRKR